MSAARRARTPRAGLRVALALLCALGSVACGRPGQAGAQTAPNQIDFTSPGSPRWPGFGQDAPAAELTDADVEQVATKVDATRVPVPGSNPSKGPLNARVTLQVWSDFECPFCIQVAPTLARLEQRYRGRIRLVWWNYPLPSHERARPAARAARAAFELGGDAQFWKLHDWLFSARADLSDAGLSQAAAQLRLEPRVADAARDASYDSRIEVDMNAADLAGVEGTPAVFINQYYMMGARPEAEYAIVIERALRETSG